MDRPYSKLEKVKEPKVFLATPMGKNSNMHGQTAAFCGYTAGLPDVQWGYTSTLSAEMSRNTLIEDHNHCGGDWTHVLFVDSDTVPPNHALQTLLSADADVITGIYPLLLKKGFFWSITEMDNDNNWIPMHKNLPREPFEILSCGAGCLLVRREVLEDIEWPYFKFEYQSKWENGGDPIKCGEDMYFCRKARDKGYKVMADPFIICKHFNNVDLLKALRFAKKIFKKEQEEIG